MCEALQELNKEADINVWKIKWQDWMQKTQKMPEGGDKNLPGVQKKQWSPHAGVLSQGLTWKILAWAQSKPFPPFSSPSHSPLLRPSGCLEVAVFSKQSSKKWSAGGSS